MMDMDEALVCHINHVPVKWEDLRKRFTLKMIEQALRTLQISDKSKITFIDNFLSLEGVILSFNRDFWCHHREIIHRLDELYQT